MTSFFDSGFEEFTKRAAPPTKDPHLTIQRRGSFSLNAAAFEALGEPEAVKLLYDRERNLIGLSPVKLGAPNGYPVRQAGSKDREGNNRAGKTWLLAGKAFCDFYGIPTEPARKYAAQTVEGGLVIDLNGDSQTVTSGRAKRDDGDD